MPIRLPSYKKIFSKIIIAKLIGALFISGPFLYANGRTPKKPVATNQIGLGTSFSSSLYKSGDKFDIPVVPSINYNYKRFSFRGIAAGLRLLPLTKLTLTPDFNKVEAESGTYNEGLTERDRSLDLGLSFLLPSKWFVTNISFATDISGRSKANKFDIGISKSFKIDIWKSKILMIIPGIFYERNSSHWSKYYFGVTQEEARADRPLYTPEAAQMVGARMVFAYPIAKKYILNAFYSYRKFSSAVKDSPLVKRGHRESVFFGINYILGESTR